MASPSSAASSPTCPPGSERLTLRSLAPDGPARVVLLGGPPFGEPIVMWWNFLGGSHDEIVDARTDWQAELAAAGTPPAAEEGVSSRERGSEHPLSRRNPSLDAGQSGDGTRPSDGARFGDVPGYPGAALPAPGLPGTRLLPRA